MSRKSFIESCGGTCVNWTWSWSFVNHDEKFVIFGAWDVAEDGNRTRILNEAWATSRRGRKQPAYPQSREHIRLVEEMGYRLKTFRMVQARANEDDDESPAKIADFVRQLEDKQLIRAGSSWYASDGTAPTSIPEEVDPSVRFTEGAVSSIVVNSFERNWAARAACLKHHGIKCVACGFDFETKYGPLGKGYIHVHHVVPLAQIRAEYRLDPIKDLVPICPNCHAIVHSTNPPLTIEQLKAELRQVTDGA
jgi:5-methylcytosine-specific restriction enzyme A